MDLLVEIKDSITVQEAVDFVESPSCGEWPRFYRHGKE